MYHDDAITPAHRLDRATAGVVVFVRNPRLRGAFQMLFQNRQAHKAYECLAPLAPVCARRCVGVTEPLAPPRAFPLRRRSHITKLRGVIQAFEEPGAVNASTVIRIACRQTALSESDPSLGVPLAPVGLRAYDLLPLTGKTHQLRVHMNALGLPILGDDIYPRLVERPYDDFSMPLQLVARELRFLDPRDGTLRVFRSRIPLEVPAAPGAWR